uniref:Family with sequence similarity 162 member A n=1 Tax=Taeniopygia guttata TaxID=59729 RepID=A0A674GR60_TAEGU
MSGNMSIKTNKCSPSYSAARSPEEDQCMSLHKSVILNFQFFSLCTNSSFPFLKLSSLLFTKSLTGKETFRNERRPTSFDKKVLVWSGCFKKEEDIPRHISSEVLDTARNIARIKVCYIMIVLTVLGCVAIIITGKEAAKKHQTLLRVNAEKKAKWRAAVEKGQEAAAGKSQ